jgi:hypothetical protein
MNRTSTTKPRRPLLPALFLSAIAPFLAQSACGPSGLTEPSVHCGEVWQPTTLTAPSDITPLLVGKWGRCGGGEPASLAAPFEFADDGKWYQLGLQSDGSTVRLEGFGQAGTWEVDAAWQVDTAGRIFVYFNNAPGSSLWSSVSFNLDPRVMQLDPALYAPLR